MIQRIQTIYLLCAIILTSALFYVPFCKVINENIETTKQTESYILDNQGIYEIVHSKHNLIKESSVFNSCLVVFMLVTFFSIFLYKNRKLQVRIIKTGILVIVLFFLFMNYELFNMADLSDSAGNIRFLAGWYIPFAQIIFLIFSIRAINRDEELVKSADRLR